MRINCRPRLTEDHILQIEAAAMSLPPGQIIEVDLDQSDLAKVPQIIELLADAGLSPEISGSVISACSTGANPS